MPGRTRNTAGSPATIFYRKGSYRLQITNIRNSSQSLTAVLQLSKKKLADMHSNRIGSRQTFSEVPLIEFTLNRNHLVDADLPTIIAFVQDSPTIQSLELFGNMLTDVSTSLLAGFLSKSSLQRLKIGDNLFTAKGALTLAQGLTGAASHLVQLHVGGNSLGGKGVEAICDACQENHIESLGLRDIDFDACGWIAIGRATSSPNARINELQLKGNKITELALDSLIKGSAANLLQGPVPNRLTYVAVNNCELTPELMRPFVAWLAGASQLSTIDVRHNAIKDEGLAVLLELIEVQSGHLLDDPNSEPLSLMIAHCDITRATCELLSQCPSTLKRLGTLDIGFNPLGEESSISLASVITASSKLEKVILHHCNLAGESILHLGSALASHPFIKDIDFSCNYTRINCEGWCAVVEKAAVLEQLSLTDNEITSKGLSDIALALSKRISPTLVSLQLGGQSKTPPLANAKNPAAHNAVSDLLNRNRVVHDIRWGAKETVSVRPPMPQPMYPPPMPIVHSMMPPAFGNSPNNMGVHNMSQQLPFGYSPMMSMPMTSLPGYPPSVLGNPSPLVLQSNMSSSSGFMHQDPVMSLPQGSGFMPQMQPMMFANQMGHQGMPQYFGGMIVQMGMNSQMTAMNNQNMNQQMNNQHNMVGQQHGMGNIQQGIGSLSQGSLSCQGLGQSLGSPNLANQPINSHLSAPNPGMPQHTMNQAMTQGLNPTGTMFPH